MTEERVAQRTTTDPAVWAVRMIGRAVLLALVVAMIVSAVVAWLDPAFHANAIGGLLGVVAFGLMLSGARGPR